MHTVRTAFSDDWLAPVVAAAGVMAMLLGFIIAHGDAGGGLRTLGLAAYGTGMLRIDYQARLRFDQRYLSGFARGRRETALTSIPRQGASGSSN